MKKTLLSLYGLKWNPFNFDLPVDGIVVNAAMENFCWRLENLVMDGGFAMISGPVGSGKSVTLRWLSHKLSAIKDVHVVAISRPQSGIADFYRELGDLFGLSLQVSNRFSSYRNLREKWLSHIDSTMLRPVLLIDEAQEMFPVVLSELRLIASQRFDSQSLLTVVLCGDERLGDKFRNADLLPLGSRIKTRFTIESMSREEMITALEEAMRQAGNPTLLSKELLATLAERSMGNYRAMMQMAGELLNTAAKQELSTIDEKLFFKLNESKSKKKK